MASYGYHSRARAEKLAMWTEFLVSFGLFFMTGLTGFMCVQVHVHACSGQRISTMSFFGSQSTLIKSHWPGTSQVEQRPPVSASPALGLQSHRCFTGVLDMGFRSFTLTAYTFSLCVLFLIGVSMLSQYGVQACNPNTGRPRQNSLQEQWSMS